MTKYKEGSESFDEFGREFLSAAEIGRVTKVQSFLDDGFPINYQDKRSGLTALHSCAATRARGTLRVLLASDECDYLIRDGKGRLPSEMAYLFGEDPAVARLLGIKERKQAQEQGVKLTRRP